MSKLDNLTNNVTYALSELYSNSAAQATDFTTDMATIIAQFYADYSGDDCTYYICNVDNGKLIVKKDANDVVVPYKCLKFVVALTSSDYLTIEELVVNNYNTMSPTQTLINVDAANTDLITSINDFNTAYLSTLMGAAACAVDASGLPILVFEFAVN
jgi:hypothetical protein